MLNKINKNLKTPRKLGEKIAIIVGVICTALFGIVVVIVLLMFIESHQRSKEIKIQTETAPQKIASSLAPAEQAADLKIRKLQQLIENAEAGTQLIASSKVDICYITSYDQGFLVAGHQQKCKMRYVLGYNTTFDKEPLKQKLLSMPEATSFFTPEDKKRSPTLDSCELYQEDYRDSSDGVTTTFRPVNVSEKEYNCKIPEPTDVSFNSLGSEIATKVYRSFDTRAVGNTTYQLWLTYDKIYYEEDIGCGSGLIFCDNPRPIPAVAP